MTAERKPDARVEAVCEVMHDAYEAAAVEQGWETQARSRKPWADVPEANKATMRAAVGAALAFLAQGAAERIAEAIRDALTDAYNPQSDEHRDHLADVTRIATAAVVDALYGEA